MIKISQSKSEFIIIVSSVVLVIASKLFEETSGFVSAVLPDGQITFDKNFSGLDDGIFIYISKFTFLSAFLVGVYPFKNKRILKKNAIFFFGMDDSILFHVAYRTFRCTFIKNNFNR